MDFVSLHSGIKSFICKNTALEVEMMEQERIFTIKDKIKLLFYMAESYLYKLQDHYLEIYIKENVMEIEKS